MIISKRKSEQGNGFLEKWKLFRGTAFLPCACSLRESQRLWVIWTVSHKALQTGESLLLPRLPWLQPSTTQSISFGSWTSGQLSERLHTVLLWSKLSDGFSLRFPDVQWHRFLQCGWGLPSGSSIISLCGSSWVGSILTTQKHQQCGKVNKSVGGTLPAPGHRRTTCKLWLLSQQIYLEGQDASKVNSSSVADILLLFPQKELASWLIQKQRARGWGRGGGSCRIFPLPSEIEEWPSETWSHFFKHSRPSLLLLKWFEDECSVWMDGVHQNTIL